VTPADSHLALAGECLRAGKDCFVEKPLAIDVPEGRALAEIVAATGRILQVGHVFRFHPVTTAIRELLATGDLGGVRYATGRFAGFKPPRADVGVTMTDAIHYFDLFTYMLGQAPVAVTATLRDYLGRGMDDCSFATVEHGRIPAFVEAGYFAPGTYRDCVIVGERATLAADFGSSEVRVHANQHVKGAGGWQAPEGPVEAVKASGKEPLSHELELFLDAVAHRTAPAVDVDAGLSWGRPGRSSARPSRCSERWRLRRVWRLSCGSSQQPCRSPGFSWRAICGRRARGTTRAIRWWRSSPGTICRRDPGPIW
jgi:predicted dehydrogenase